MVLINGVCWLAQFPSQGDPLCRLSRWGELQDHSPLCTIVQTQNTNYRTLPETVAFTIVIIDKNGNPILICQWIAAFIHYQTPHFVLLAFCNLPLGVGCSVCFGLLDPPGFP
ncbi:MAG TPA: hypothetical protein DDZ51_11985 [Planctomycetaceae bacterium]|nr:hypothetical protein [Planctomycetaceae bacterium]